MSLPLKYFINDIKATILNLLPRPLAWRLYLLSHHDAIVKIQLKDGKTCEIVLPHTMTSPYEKGYKPLITKWFSDNIRQDDVVFEVGSCYGYFPAVISAINPATELHLFEPDWKNIRYLKQNALRYRNSKKPWLINEKFAGSKSGNRTIALDDYCSENNITPSIVKIDVDGAEVDVLQGCTATIAGRKTEFLVEFHSMMLGLKGLTAENFLNLFPGDFAIRLLPDIQSAHSRWTEDKTLLYTNKWHGYVYLAPSEIARIS